MAGLFHLWSHEPPPENRPDESRGGTRRTLLRAKDTDIPLNRLLGFAAGVGRDAWGDLQGPDNGGWVAHLCPAGPLGVVRGSCKYARSG
jgi:hypothetical protein